MDKNPLVSICIPTYNGESYIAEAIKSVINQDYKNIEVVISDDHSSDQTIPIATQLLKKSQIKFKVISHQPQGIGENWNNAIRHSNGEYIKLLFQDDLLSSQCISKMILGFNKGDQIGMVFCARHIISLDDQKNADWLSKYKTLHDKWSFNLKNGAVSGKKLLGCPKLFDSPINKIGEPPATLIKRECFDKIGYFSNHLVQALDVEYWWRVMSKYDLVFIDEPLISFRLHEAQQSSKNLKRKIKDFELLPFILFSRYFWKLHNKLKLKILRDMLAIKKNKLFPK